MGTGASLVLQNINVTTANVKSFRKAICDTEDVIDRFAEIIFKWSFSIEILKDVLSNYHGRNAYMEFLRNTYVSESYSS